METKGKSGGPHAEIGCLSLGASVVLASGSMSAADVDRARRNGGLAMMAAAGGTVMLEVGGVVIAQGIIRKKRGKSAFVVTRAFSEGSEAIA